MAEVIRLVCLGGGSHGGLPLPASEKSFRGRNSSHTAMLSLVFGHVKVSLAKYEKARGLSTGFNLVHGSEPWPNGSCKSSRVQILNLDSLMLLA